MLQKCMQNHRMIYCIKRELLKNEIWYYSICDTSATWQGIPGSNSLEWPWNSFHKEFMSLLSNSCKYICYSYMKSIDLIRSQFCTCHDSWAVMTCAKLWHDWIIRIELKSKWIFKSFQLWAQKLFVKWVTDVTVATGLPGNWCYHREHWNVPTQGMHLGHLLWPSHRFKF